MATVRTPAVRASAVDFRVGGIDILTDVDLEIKAGELVGIIGPNGAGKTTLLNLITGLLSPTSGMIEMHGRDLSSLRPAQRARLGMGRTFQTSSLFGSLSVFDHARLAAQARLGGSMRWWHLPDRDDRAAVLASAALEAVGLTPLRLRPASTLSHGDKRKLELAILVAGDAQVLLLDEPMAGVNSEDVPVLSALIANLHQEGRTVLMVEHHVAVVVGLAQRIAVLHHGRLLACDSPEAVMRNATVQSAYLGDPL